MSKNLTQEKAMIFRITHRDNVPWILDNGLHCRSSNYIDPNFVSIGNEDLMEKRIHKVVNIPPGGHLSDYVPFYFTPFSPMMYNIHTGRGVPKRPNEEIVIIVSSLHRLADEGVDFVFSDRHAKLKMAQFFSDLDDLDWIPWHLLQARDFARDRSDPSKMERYQAEALPHRHVPVDALLGMICYNKDMKSDLDDELESRNMRMRIVAGSKWYF